MNDVIGPSVETVDFTSNQKTFADFDLDDRLLKVGKFLTSLWLVIGHWCSRMGEANAGAGICNRYGFRRKERYG